MRLSFSRCFLAAFSSFALSSTAMATFSAPSGYEAIPLTDGTNPLNPGGLGVSAGGRMAVTNGSTVTLYNTWQNGRTALGTVTDSTDWSFDTDPVFLNESTVLFGENGTSDALWEVNFATATPTVTELTPKNSLPAVQGVALTSDKNHVIVSGSGATGFNSGSLYLKSVDLSSPTDAISNVVTGVGTGYAGSSGVTPGGNLALLEANFGGSSLAHIYASAGAPVQTNPIALDNGNGSGAYGIAFDAAGNAYVTTTNTITEISNIDSASPAVTNFGSAVSDGSFPFYSSIAFTGGQFIAGQVGDTGALIVNDGGGGGAFAIVVPEPTTLSLLAAGGIAFLSRRRKGMSR
jgi:hypothetical protein